MAWHQESTVPLIALKNSRSELSIIRKRIGASDPILFHFGKCKKRKEAGDFSLAIRRKTHLARFYMLIHLFALYLLHKSVRLHKIMH